MIWLHMLFVLVFVPANGSSVISPAAENDDAAIPPLYFSCMCTNKVDSNFQNSLIAASSMYYVQVRSG